MVKVVVTGTGIISAAGTGALAIFDAMIARKNLFGNTYTYGTTGVILKLPWPVASMDLSHLSWPKHAPWPNLKKYANSAAEQAVAVALLAIDQSGLAGVEDGARCGTVLASESRVDELVQILPQVAALAEMDPRSLAELLYDELPDYSYLRSISPQIGQFICLATGFRGSNVSTFGEAGTGGLGGLSLAMRLLQSEELDRVMVVAVGMPMSPANLVEADKAELLGKEAFPGRGPFDLKRCGTLLGSGAAAVVLEREDVARKRGTPVLAELLACETICAGTRMEALTLVTGLVLEQAKLSPDVWWAHGSGAVALDLEECLTLGDRIKAPTTSSKGTIGNAFESAGLTDVILAVEALKRRQVPPVGLLEQPDPALGEIDFVAGNARTLSDPRSAFVTALDRQTSAAGAVMVAKRGNC